MPKYTIQELKDIMPERPVERFEYEMGELGKMTA